MFEVFGFVSLQGEGSRGSEEVSRALGPDKGNESGGMNSGNAEQVSFFCS